MRRPNSLLILVIGSLLVLGLAVGLVSAGQVPVVTYDVTITAVSCSEISFDYVNNEQTSGGFDFATVTITVDGSTVYNDSEAGSPFDGSLTIGLSLVPGQPHTIVVTVSLPGLGSGSAATRIVCGGSSTDLATGRVCFGPGTVPAAVFFDGYRIDVYAIDPDDNGELVMSFTQDFLITLPAKDEQARLLGDSDVHIPIEFYRNANGFYRAVAGPDAEGKTFECTFGGACSVERSWIGEANAPTDELVPECPVAPTPTHAPTTTPLPTR